VSGRPQVRTAPERTFRQLRGDDLIPSSAGPTRRLCHCPSTLSPQYGSLALHRAEDHAGLQNPQPHSLLLQPEAWPANNYRSAAARWRRHPYIGALQTNCSIERQFSRISPAFPRSLASVLVPRPAALDVLLRLSRPSGLGFQQQISRAECARLAAQRTGEISRRSLHRKHAFGLGSGAHSRRCAQECPEGNPGKYTQEK
jgi:hypothetical protein